MRNREELYELYTKAVSIENKSQSPRIKKLRPKHCKVTLGIVDPDLTEILFILRNPGGHEVSSKESSESRVEEFLKEYEQLYYPMKKYLAQDIKKERLACNLKKFIDAFILKLDSKYDNWVNKFGVTNMSFFNSETTDDEVSFCIESIESSPIVLEEINIPKVKMIIFAGVPYEYFFHSLYMKNSAIFLIKHNTEFPNKIAIKCENGKIKKYRFNSFKAKLVTNKVVTCIFTIHFSATRGISNQLIEKIAYNCAEIFQKFYL